MHADASRDRPMARRSASALLCIALASPALAPAAAPVPASGASAPAYPLPPCAERYVSVRMAQGRPPWRDGPARALAEEALRLCRPSLVTIPGTAGQPPRVASAPAFDASEPATASDITQLAARIDGWRTGRTPWFPATGVEKVKLPNLQDTGTTSTCPAPDYPAVALRAGATGRTGVGFDIAEDGHIVDLVLWQTAGGSREHRQLDIAALDAAARCVFEPAPGVPLRRLIQAYDWKLM